MAEAARRRAGVGQAGGSGIAAVARRRAASLTTGKVARMVGMASSMPAPNRARPTTRRVYSTISACRSTRVEVAAAVQRCRSRAASSAITAT